ncbi:hypothetical protein D3C86_1887630 [compost metagenome]
MSPKANVNPVTMMMITATIFATGPWIESRIDCSGASQGMLEPAARAGSATASKSIAAVAACRNGFAEVREIVMTVLQKTTGLKGQDEMKRATGNRTPPRCRAGSPRCRGR